MTLTLLAGLLALAESWRRWLADVRRSRLLNPKVFELPPVPEAIVIYARAGDPDRYLVGRDRDIGNLGRTIQSNSLVFVDGPSGVGKSMLLKLGVACQLARTGTWLPVYIDVWGADWEKGPRQALTDALQVAVEHGLGDESREKLGLLDAVKAKSVMDSLKHLRAKSGRRPVLFFDQLDDYQNRHWQRFSEPEDGTIISAERLTRENGFWREIRDLLRERAVHCVFAIRSDASRGLAAFRFEQPAVYPVYRLSSSHVRTMIANLVDEAAVSEPENGFHQLVERLASDLNHSGHDHGVLPVQMRVVLSGLRTLRRLTPAGLHKQGGVEGLEAAYLKRHVQEAPGTPRQIRTLLRQLVDYEPGRECKTLSKTLGELASGSGLPAAIIEPALQALEREGVLRRRLEPGSGEVWQLYHDYLAPTVLALEREQHYWETYLAEQAAVFEQSAGLRKWRSLVPPGSLLRLCWERLRGRLRFGLHRRYLAWSAPRLLLNLWVLMAASVAIALPAYRVRELSQKLVRSFDVAEDNLSAQELNALWELHAASTTVKSAVLWEFLGSSVNAPRFQAHRDAILFALSNMDLDLREALLRDVVGPLCYRSPPVDEDLVGACVIAIYHFDTSQERASLFADEILNRAQISRGVQRLDWLAKRLDAGRLEKARQQVLDLIEREENEADLADLYSATATLGSHLGAASALDTINRLLDDFDRRESEALFLDLEGEMQLSISGLTPYLDTDAADLFSERVISSLIESDFRSSLDAKLLASLVPRLRVTRVDELAKVLEQLAENRDDDLNLDQIFWVRAQIAKRLGPAEAERLAEAEHAALAMAPLRPMDENTFSIYKYEESLRRLSMLGVKPEPEMRRSLMEWTLSRLELMPPRTLSVDKHTRLLALIGDDLDPQYLRRAAEIVLRQQAKGSLGLASPGHLLNEFGYYENLSGLRHVADYVTPPEASITVSQIIQYILAERRRVIWSEVGLAELAARLEADDARRVHGEILDTMAAIQGDHQGLTRLAALGAGLTSVARVLGADQGLLEQTLARTRMHFQPPCGAVSYLADEGTVVELMDLLQWPTCTSEGRREVIDRIAVLSGDPQASTGRRQDFGHGLGPEYWAFVQWAENRGL